MIVTEERIRDIVSQMPKIEINPDYSAYPKFHWGDRKELVKFIEINKEDSYPLIWLLLGEEHHIDRGFLCERECMFVIATRETNKSLLNHERFEKAYKIVLNPVLDLLLQGLDNSSVSRIVNANWRVQRMPDYTESYYKNDNDNYTIDLWDALKLEVLVEFNNNCLNKITWQ